VASHTLIPALYSQHSGGRGRRISSSRPAWAIGPGHISKKTKKKNCFEDEKYILKYIKKD
jgi:hypothetical protein